MGKSSKKVDRGIGSLDFCHSLNSGLCSSISSETYFENVVDFMLRTYLLDLLLKLIDEKQQLHAYKVQIQYSYTFKQASIFSNLQVYFSAVLRWPSDSYNSDTCELNLQMLDHSPNYYISESLPVPTLVSLYLPSKQ